MSKKEPARVQAAENPKAVRTYGEAAARTSLRAGFRGNEIDRAMHRRPSAAANAL